MVENDSVASSLKVEYTEVFTEDLGTFKSVLYWHLKDTAPVFVKGRALPIALRQPVERELERLQRAMGEASYLKNLRTVLERLKSNGFRINFSKCDFLKIL